MLQPIIDYLCPKSEGLFFKVPKLPVEIVLKILAIEPQNLGKACVLNKSWKGVAEDPRLWNTYCYKFDPLFNSEKESNPKKFMEKLIKKQMPAQLSPKEYLKEGLPCDVFANYANPYTPPPKQTYLKFIKKIHLNSCHMQEYRRSIDQFTIQNMEGWPIVLGHADKKLRVIFFRLRKENDASYQVLFALKERWVAKYSLGIIPYHPGSTKWKLRVLETPFTSRFIRHQEVPLYSEQYQLRPMTNSVSKTIYRSKHEGMTLGEMLKKIFKKEVIQLNGEDPEERYCLDVR